MARTVLRYVVFLGIACLLVLIVLVAYYQGQMSEMNRLCPILSRDAGLKSPNGRSNTIGFVRSRDANLIPNAVVEQIQFYAQENENSRDTIMRTGVLVRYKDAVGTILLCHGFMCDKFDSGFLRRLFPRGRYNLLSFDFRAHGEHTQGQCCTFGKNEAYDVLAAGEFIKNHPDLADSPLFVYGFSMGAVAAIEAQARDPQLFKAMILDCPFEASDKLLARILDQIKVSVFGYEFALPGRTMLQRYAFHPYVQSIAKYMLKTVAQLDPKNINIQMHQINPCESIKKVKVPSFFILCKHDEKVSVDAIKNVYANCAAKNKTLWLTHGRRHFDSFFYNPERYMEYIREFLDKAVEGSLYTTEQEVVVDDDAPFAYEEKGIMYEL